MFKVKFNKLIAMFMSIVIAMEFLAPSIGAFASDVSTDQYSNGDTVLEKEPNAEDEAKEEAKEKNQYSLNQSTLYPIQTRSSARCFRICRYGFHQSKRANS